MIINNNKVLYFEGAGWDYNNSSCNIGNHRIRTAFLNNDKKRVYLEISNHEFKDKKSSEWKCFVSCAFYIEDDEKEIRYLERKLPNIKKCNRKGITEWINEHFSCSFEDIEVLNSFEGYRVHGSNSKYNLIDDHTVNKERALKRQKAYDKIDQYFREKLNSKYSKIGLLKMDDNSITIRCHASEESMKNSGLKEREVTIEII